MSTVYHDGNPAGPGLSARTMLKPPLDVATVVQLDSSHLTFDTCMFYAKLHLI